MDRVLQIYKTEIKKKYQKNLLLEDLPTLKDLWEDHKEINITILIECICLQMNIMETLDMTFYALSMEDIYMCDNIFVVLGKTIKVSNNKFTFYSPPILDKKKYLHYPEFFDQKNIPCSFDKSVIYYSIGLIVLTCLASYPIFLNGAYYINEQPICSFIENIKGKPYFFLKRCFVNRELLFI